MMTNIGKTKAEVIVELVLSMNRGNSGYINGRVDDAICQYRQLVRAGIIEENPHHREPHTVERLPELASAGTIIYKIE